MDWTIFTQVTLPMIGGFAWMIIRMDKKFDKIDEKFERIQKTLEDLNNRMSRLEGRFEERGYWESRDKKIGE
jgi:hypothetical protein